MSASSKFFQQGSRKYSSRFLTKCKGWLEDHPVLSNSLLTLNLWIAGDLLAQYSEHQVEEKQQQQQQRQQKKLLLPSAADKNNISTAATVAAADDSRNLQKHTNDSTTTETESESTKYNFRRTVQCASYGAIFQGPLLAVWYPYLDRICGPKGFNVTSRFGGSLWAAPVAKVLADEFLMDPPCLLVFFGYMNVCEGGTIQSYQHKLQNEFMTSWLTSLAIWPIVLLGTFRYLPVYSQAPVINACCIIWDGFLSHRNAVAKIKEAETNHETAAAVGETEENAKMDHKKAKKKKENDDNKQ